MSSGGGDRVARHRYAPLRPHEAGRPGASRDGRAAALGGAAAQGRPLGRVLQPRRLPDEDEGRRAAARDPHDPRPGECDVRALRLHAPQHVHQRPEAPDADVPREARRARVLRRPDHRRGGLRGVGRGGPPRGALHRRRPRPPVPHRPRRPRPPRGRVLPRPLPTFERDLGPHRGQGGPGEENREAGAAGGAGAGDGAGAVPSGILISLTFRVPNAKNDKKPTITVLYDAEEDRVRAEALAKKEKFPSLVSTQVADVLTKRGYEVKLLAAQPPIKKLVRLIEDDNSDLIFNVCESLGGDGGEERRIAAVLELLDKRFTGSGSLALTLAGDKSLSKKLFDFHRVSSPEFAIIGPGRVEAKATLNTFPLMVKPIATDASIGINARSIVNSIDEMMERVFAIHAEFHTPALVEQYIEGREIYVGLLGSPLEALPPIEWDLSKLPPDLPRIAGTEAKWEHDFKEAKEFVPKDVVKDPEIMNRIREVALGAWKALMIRDYARIDMRLTSDGVPYVIEVNPNPWLDSRAEFAMAARGAKMSPGDVIERLVQLAAEHPIRERSAI